MDKPSLPTIKRLFAQAGRRCAFPGCTTPIVGENGTIIGEICHIRARKAGGERYDSSQNEAERHGYDNLLLLCPTHHKTIDAQPEAFSVELLLDMKAEAEANNRQPEHPDDAFFAAALLTKLSDNTIANNTSNIAINSPGAVQTGTLILNTRNNKTKILPSAGSIGADGDKRRYVKYLIDRYIQFAKGGPGPSGPFKPAVIYASIKREFGGQWELLSVAHFADICVYLQNRISKTSIGKINAAKGQKLYSSFEGYLHKHGK